MSERSVKICVITHKKYEMPELEMYLPLGVGKMSSNLGYVTDNTGENIASKNMMYNELTGMYWMWKNLPNLNYYGLFHYRRYMTTKGKKIKSRFKKEKLNYILELDDVEQIMKSNRYPIFLPQKRNYVYENLEKHFLNANPRYINEYKEFCNLLNIKYPEYGKAFQKVMGRKSAHMFNMFVMERRVFQEYCEWLFDILFNAEKVLCAENDKPRLMGLLSEYMLDTWLEVNQIEYVELPVLFLEQTDWFQKGYKFIKRSIKGKNAKRDKGKY